MIRTIKNNLPNAITCANLFCGCVGIVFAFKNQLNFAAYAIFLAAFLDFLDGMLARLLKAYSDIGKELDSLADMVSFGVLPAAIVFQLFALSLQSGFGGTYLSYTAFLIPVFSALRLAKFNTDARQSDVFIGLPTPANAILIASIPLIISQGSSFLLSFIFNGYFLLFFVLLMCFLLVAGLPLLSLKFKGFGLKGNIERYLLIGLSVILTVIFKFAAIPAIILLYIAISIIQVTLKYK